MPHRIYHWKHGWIPLDHAAAISKAKGNESGARRYLASSHAAGHAHPSVVSGSYAGGTHVRGLQPVAREHLPRRSSVTAAFSPDSRRFALLDRTGHSQGKQQETSTSIPESLAEHFHAKNYQIWRVRHEDNGQHRVVVSAPSGEVKSFAADGSDIGVIDPERTAPNLTPSGSNPSGARWTKISTEEALGPDTRTEQQKKWDAYTASAQRGRRTTRNAGARERALAKVKEAYRHENGHVVLIEPAMSRAKTEQFLSSVHDVIGGASSKDLVEPLRFHVATGDRNFSSGRTLAYVRTGEHAVYVSPKLAAGEAEQPKGTTHFMPAHESMPTQRYALAHELGHVIDHKHGHVNARTGRYSGGTSQMNAQDKTQTSLFAEYRGQLSKYGATSPSEAYAEAYAQWHSGQHNAVANAYAARYGWTR